MDHDRAVLEKVPFEWAHWEAAEIAPNATCRRYEVRGIDGQQCLRSAVSNKRSRVVGSCPHAFFRRRVPGEVLDQIIGTVERGVLTHSR